MITLPHTDVLRARLSGAPATTNPAFAFSWADYVADSPGRTLGALNGTTNVSLVAAPATGESRMVRSGFIYNADTASVTVIIEQYDGTTARQLAKITIPTTATLRYDDNGFEISTASGTVGDMASAIYDPAGISEQLVGLTATQTLTHKDLSSSTNTFPAVKYDWIIALGDETTAITTGTAKVTVRAPRAMTLSKIKASLTTASSSGTPTFDVKKNGTSVFSTTLTIDATETTSETAATPAVLSTTAIAADDILTFDITTAGTSAAGAKITLVGTA